MLHGKMAGQALALELLSERQEQACGFDSGISFLEDRIIIFSSLFQISFLLFPLRASPYLWQFFLLLSRCAL